MRRRVVPALIALLAAALAAWRRRVTRDERPGLADAPARPALTGAPRRLEARATDAPEPEPAAPETPDASAPDRPEPEPATPETLDAPAVAPEPPDTPAAAPETPPTPAPRPPQQPDARAATARFVSIPWTLATDEDAARQQRELPIQFTLLGDRMALDRVDVRETDSQVFVTVLARYEPPAPGRRWVPYGVARDALVALDRPLGDRALVHAPDQLDELTHGGG